MDTTERQHAASTWFRSLRDQICTAFEAIEDELQGTPHQDLPQGRFERQPWQHGEGGGGEIAMMRGRVFEKVGVNISTVNGVFPENFRAQIPGAEENGTFWASGISVVAHMRSPLVPAVHMNTRHIVTTRSWFGGGTDLTPMFMDAPQAKEDKKIFHSALKTVCDKHGTDYYEKFSKWCDDYFYLPHRQEPRGVGGIFFDYLEDSWDKNFAFIQDVGLTFLKTYPALVRQHMEKAWSAKEREQQLIRRGRYVEFNLLYDRGTLFGLKTKGPIDGIFMSLPPEVKWP